MGFRELPGWLTHPDVGTVLHSEKAGKRYAPSPITCPMHLFHLPVKPSSTKTEFPWWVYDKPLCPKLFLFLSHLCYPQDWTVSKKSRDWNRTGICGPSQVQKHLRVPCSLLVEKGFSLLGLPWVPKSRLKQLLIREVREHRNKGRAVKQEKW